MTTARAAHRAVSAGDFEVATVSSDTLRAAIDVAGALSARTGPLLLSVIDAHVRAGRRYLRVDLEGAHDADTDALTLLRDAHARLIDLGGLLVFENATGRLDDALRSADLFVRVPF